MLKGNSGGCAASCACCRNFGVWSHLHRTEESDRSKDIPSSTDVANISFHLMHEILQLRNESRKLEVGRGRCNRETRHVCLNAGGLPMSRKSGALYHQQILQRASHLITEVRASNVLPRDCELQVRRPHRRPWPPEMPGTPQWRNPSHG